MEQKLSTVLTRIDLKDLLNHYTDKALWGKKWTIYDYGDITVTAELYSIEVKSNEIKLSVTVQYKGKRKRLWYYSTYNWTWMSVPINHCEYTQEVFERKLYGVAMNILSNLESNYIRALPDYIKAAEYREEREKALIEEAKVWLDDKGVTIESVREAYTDAFVSANSKDVDDMVDGIVRRHKDKLFAKEQMLLADFFKREKEFRYFYDLVKKKGGSKSRITIWLQKQKDQKIDWESVCDDFMKTEG